MRRLLTLKNISVLKNSTQKQSMTLNPKVKLQNFLAEAKDLRSRLDLFIDRLENECSEIVEPPRTETIIINGKRHSVDYRKTSLRGK